MYIDTHCHYDIKQFNQGRFELLAYLKRVGIEQIVVPAVSAESNENMRRKLDVIQHPNLLDGKGFSVDEMPKIWYAAGVHPTRIWGKHIASESQWEKWIRRAAQQPDTVAIGETGLDYHHEMGADMYESQHRWFQKQLAIAEEYELPLILHIRMADDDAIGILEQHSLTQGGVVHCYCGGWDVAKKYLDMGLMLGIGGAVTLPNRKDLQEAVRHLPLASILLETDAPYVKPVWELDFESDVMENASDDVKRWASWNVSEDFDDNTVQLIRKKCNTSENIPRFAEAIAEIKEISVDMVREQANENAKRLFHI